MSKGITLEQLLKSRDIRSQKQKLIINDNRGLTLVCMTVIIPGNIKRNSLTSVIATAGIEELKKEFEGSIISLEICNLETGYEAYLLTSKSREQAKEIACKIEDNHPLGRLLDIDVLDEKGEPISRKEMGEEPRKCFICNMPARECMRNNTHTTEELYRFISEKVEDYVHRI